MKSFREQRGDGFRFLLEFVGQLTKPARFGPWRLLYQEQDLLAEVGQSLTFTGDNRHDRDTQFEGQLARIDAEAVVPGDIDHVQGDESGIPELNHLSCIVEV